MDTEPDYSEAFDAVELSAGGEDVDLYTEPHAAVRCQKHAETSHTLTSRHGGQNQMKMTSRLKRQHGISEGDNDVGSGIMCKDDAVDKRDISDSAPGVRNASSCDLTTSNADRVESFDNPNYSRNIVTPIYENVNIFPATSDDIFSTPDYRKVNTSGDAPNPDERLHESCHDVGKMSGLCEECAGDPDCENQYELAGPIRKSGNSYENPDLSGVNNPQRTDLMDSSNRVPRDFLDSLKDLKAKLDGMGTLCTENLRRELDAIESQLAKLGGGEREKVGSVHCYLDVLPESPLLSPYAMFNQDGSFILHRKTLLPSVSEESNGHYQTIPSVYDNANSQSTIDQTDTHSCEEHGTKTGDKEAMQSDAVHEHTDGEPVYENNRISNDGVTYASVLDMPVGVHGTEYTANGGGVYYNGVQGVNAETAGVWYYNVLPNTLGAARTQEDTGENDDYLDEDDCENDDDYDWFSDWDDDEEDADNQHHYFNLAETGLDVAEPSNKLHHAVHELRTTEECYTRRLSLLLQAQSSTERLLGSEVANTMFPCLRKMHSVHEVFLQYLKERDSMWGSNKRLGDVLDQLCPHLIEYATYVVNFDRINDFMKFWIKKSKKFSNMLLEIQKSSQADRKISLKSHLTEPITRIMRYGLLIGEYLKYARRDETMDEDVIHVEGCAQTITRTLEHFEEEIRKQKELEELPLVKGPWLTVINSPRRLLKHGPVSKVKQAGRENRYAILLSDMLLLCKEQTFPLLLPQATPKYQVRQVFDLAALQMDDRPDLDLCFDLTTKQNSVTLATSDQNTKVEWQLAIQGAITKQLGSTRDWVRGGSSGPVLGTHAPGHIAFPEVTRCMVCCNDFSTFFKERSPTSAILRRPSLLPPMELLHMLQIGKHHCAACGSVVCRDCIAKKKIKLAFAPTEKKVCVRCYQTLTVQTGYQHPITNIKLEMQKFVNYSGELLVTRSCPPAGPEPEVVRWVEIHDRELKIFPARWDLIPCDDLPLHEVELSETHYVDGNIKSLLLTTVEPGGSGSGQRSYSVRTRGYDPIVLLRWMDALSTAIDTAKGQFGWESLSSTISTPSTARSSRASWSPLVKMGSAGSVFEDQDEPETALFNFPNTPVTDASTSSTSTPSLTPSSTVKSHPKLLRTNRKKTSSPLWGRKRPSPVFEDGRIDQRINVEHYGAESSGNVGANYGGSVIDIVKHESSEKECVGEQSVVTSDDGNEEDRCVQGNGAKGKKESLDCENAVSVDRKLKSLVLSTRDKYKSDTFLDVVSSQEVPEKAKLRGTNSLDILVMFEKEDSVKTGSDCEEIEDHRCFILSV